MKDVSEVMTNPLTSWIDAPASYRGIRFWRNGDWEWWAYGDLAGFGPAILAAPVTNVGD
jgi:hypothetical protein